MQFTRTYTMQRHQRESCVRRLSDEAEAIKRRRLYIDEPSQVMQTCDLCNVTVAANRMSAHQRTAQHRNKACTPLSDGVSLIQSAFRCRIQSYRVTSNATHISYALFFEEIKAKVIRLIGEMLKIHGVIKMNMELFGLYQLPTTEEFSDKSFNTTNRVVDPASNLEEIYDSLVEAMIAQTTEFQEKDSGKFKYS
jgi:hypothetical protein